MGALRKESAGHDVSVRSYDKGRFQHKGNGIESGALASRATA